MVEKTPPVPAPYQAAAPRAQYFKAVIQMIIGTVAAAAAIFTLILNLAQGDPAQHIQEQIFATIGVGLAIAAAVELAYTLFTPGPDEALDPLMLALSAALILQLGQVHTFKLPEAVSAILFVVSLAALFGIRKYLADQHEPEAYRPDFSRWQRRLESRRSGKADGSRRA